jgi:pyruvate/2-oxoglutarate/acetoin dehydrogenase E1 component
LPVGEASLKKEGNDITILAIGSVLYPTVSAAAVLSETYGIDAEILSACTLVPFDCESVLRSVEKTGKLLIVGEGRERGSFMHELAAEIGEKAFDFLDAPVITASANDQAEIIRVIHNKIIPLEGI